MKQIIFFVTCMLTIICSEYCLTTAPFQVCFLSLL